MHRNVVVAISPDTPSTSDNEAIIEGIKEWITAGNEKLHTATRERVAIGHVAILIPSSWTYDDAKTTSQITFEVRNWAGKSSKGGPFIHEVRGHLET